jgi:hypothetical protein
VLERSSARDQRSLAPAFGGILMFVTHGAKYWRDRHPRRPALTCSTTEMAAQPVSSARRSHLFPETLAPVRVSCKRILRTSGTGATGRCPHVATSLAQSAYIAVHRIRSPVTFNGGLGNLAGAGGSCMLWLRRRRVDSGLH